MPRLYIRWGDVNDVWVPDVASIVVVSLVLAVVRTGMSGMVNVGIAVVNITVVVGFSDSDVGSAVVDRTVEGFWSNVDSTVEGCLLDDSVVGEFSVVGAVDSNNKK